MHYDTIILFHKVRLAKAVVLMDSGRVNVREGVSKNFVMCFLYFYFLNMKMPKTMNYFPEFTHHSYVIGKMREKLITTISRNSRSNTI